MKSIIGMMGTSPATAALAMLVVALLAAGFDTTAAAGDDTSTIRLPSAGGGRPWECCDWVVRDPYGYRPSRWRCNDVVDECSAECQDCVESDAGDGYVCNDWVSSLLEPPVCTPRPWDCCDVAVCTRSLPPICRCADKVASCPSNCNKCELVESDPTSYRCFDTFNGFPGPKCTPWVTNKSN